MEPIKISVVVPVYNIKQFIENTVKSICSQTYRNIEIILVDDGSTDGSDKIVDQLADKDERIMVIHKENGGVTSARFRGIEAAQGEWIGFVDGDDYIEPDMYERLLDNALKYRAQISHCGYRMVFPSRVDYYYNTGRIVQQDNITGLKDLLSGSFIEPGLCNKLFHKTILHSLLYSGVMNMNIKNNEDLLMNYYLFKQTERSVYEDFCPYYYMVRKNSAATSAISYHKLNDPEIVFKTILEDVKDISELYDIVYGRLGAVYLHEASLANPGKEKYIDDFIARSRKKLKEMTPVLLSRNIGRTAKLQYRLCNFSPSLYRNMHKVYARARGTDKKYEVR